MRRSVVLVGAGATLAEALPSQPSRSRRPPLDKTFLKLCRHADLDGLPTLRRYLRDNYGLDIDASSHRMEQIFNILYADSTSQDPPDRCLDAYWALISMYRDAIRITTNPLSGTSLYGVGRLLRFLLTLPGGRQVTFVTFNQDLVIEKAIEAAKSTNTYSSIPWNIRSAYEMEFEGFASISGREVFAQSTNRRPDDTQILKLHGSLNWIRRVRSVDDAKNSLRNHDGPVYCVCNQQAFASITYTGGKRAVPTLPVIVPPIFEKSNEIGEALGGVWVAARNALVAAEELIIFGYSFPEADIAAQNMLRYAFRQNSLVEHVHIIDPDPLAGARIGGMLESSITTRYTTVRDFTSTFAK